MRVTQNLKQQGSSLIEFIIGGVFVMLILMGAIQMILAYTGASMLQQATFEAARAGIVKNGSKSAMRTAFITNSLDFHAVNGSGGTNALIARSTAAATTAVMMPLLLGGAGFELTILNPTQQAFDDFSIVKEGQRVIPNTWQHLRSQDVGPTSQVNLQDANILKIQIKYGYPLHMPVIGTIIGEAMQIIDPANIAYYRAEPVRLPLTFTAIMHMQSDLQGPRDDLIAFEAPDSE